MVDNVSMPFESPLDDGRAEQRPPSRRDYFIDPATAEKSQRSLSVLVSSRQCYMCQQGLSEDEIVASDSDDFIEQISAHCAQQQDFLLPDTRP